MKKFNFLLLMVVLALTACSSPLIVQKGKNVDMNDGLFAAHNDYDPAKPILYTIDTTFMPKAFAATGAEQDQLLNLQNNANNFGVIKSKPGTTRSIRGVANRPFDVFQAEVLPGTNIIKKDENGIPMIKPLFRVSSVPKIGFNVFVRKTDNPIPQNNLAQNNNPTDATSTAVPTVSNFPQKGPDPVGREAVEYLLKALQTGEYENQADNRFRTGTMYEVSWDVQAYPNMYKIVQRDDNGNLREIPVYGSTGMTVIDARYGLDLQFHYMDGNQPTIALYNFDKPDALSLIGLEPKGNQGWFWINPDYSNYHGDGWPQHGQNNDQAGDQPTDGSTSTRPPETMSGSQINDGNTYWDYPDKDPAAYPRGPRRLTEKIISQDYPNGRIQFVLPLLKRYSPNFFDELWKKGWVYPYQDSFSIDPNTLQNNFPEAMVNINNFAPGSFRFIKTDNPQPRQKIVKKRIVKQEPSKETEEPKATPGEKTKPTQPLEMEMSSGAGTMDDSGIHAYPLKTKPQASKPDSKTSKPKEAVKKSKNQKNSFWDLFNFGK